jgi:regulator of sigma E protease
MITPRRATPDSEFPQLGIAPAHDLRGIDAELAKEIPAADLKQDPSLEPNELFLFHPGDVITAVAGKPVTTDQEYLLTDALQAAAGRPVPVTVREADGSVRTVAVPSHFVPRFGSDAIDFGGLQMLSQVFAVQTSSPLATTKDAAGVLPGDVIVNVADAGPSGGQRPMPTADELDKFVHDAADSSSKVAVTVLRDGKSITLPPVQLTPKSHGLGLQLVTWEAEPVVAHPPAGSPADEVHVPGGARLTKVDGKPVSNWFDVYTAMCGAQADRPVPVEATVDHKPQHYTLRGLTAAELATIRQNRIDSLATDALMPATWVRRASGPTEAVKWGVGETRDAIIQVYMTVRAMFKGSISPREFSGPLGILAVGYKFAEQGSTKLLWFLSIISANLAVMNFLPIPVVDGGLFTFLIIEKLKGSPISQKTQVYAQYVGLALLLSVFLFATWQDLFRIPMLFH